MDFNVVVLSGTLAAEPEHRRFDSGKSLLRFLITIRADQPRQRIDVVPVTLWEPGEHLLAHLPRRGQGIWATGAVQRRFWDAGEGRRSTIELVAHHIEIRESDEEEEGDTGK